MDKKRDIKNKQKKRKMTKINESEITWTQIDNNLKVGTIKGLIRVIENQGNRIYFNRRRARKLKTSMLDIFKTGEVNRI
jgi:hypothetical protein